MSQCQATCSITSPLPLNELAAPVPRQLSRTFGGGSKMSIETKTLLLSHQGSVSTMAGTLR